MQISFQYNTSRFQNYYHQFLDYQNIFQSRYQPDITVFVANDSFSIYSSDPESDNESDTDTSNDSHYINIHDVSYDDYTDVITSTIRKTIYSTISDDEQISSIPTSINSNSYQTINSDLSLISQSSIDSLTLTINPASKLSQEVSHWKTVVAETCEVVLEDFNNEVNSYQIQFLENILKPKLQNELRDLNYFVNSCYREINYLIYNINSTILYLKNNEKLDINLDDFYDSIKNKITTVNLETKLDFPTLQQQKHQVLNFMCPLPNDFHDDSDFCEIETTEDGIEKQNDYKKMGDENRFVDTKMNKERVEMNVSNMPIEFYESVFSWMNEDLKIIEMLNYMEDIGFNKSLHQEAILEPELPRSQHILSKVLIGKDISESNSFKRLKSKFGKYSNLTFNQDGKIIQKVTREQVREKFSKARNGVEQKINNTNQMISEKYLGDIITQFNNAKFKTIQIFEELAAVLTNEWDQRFIEVLSYNPGFLMEEKIEKKLSNYSEDNNKILDIYKLRKIEYRQKMFDLSTKKVTNKLNSIKNWESFKNFYEIKEVLFETRKKLNRLEPDFQFLDKELSTLKFNYKTIMMESKQYLDILRAQANLAFQFREVSEAKSRGRRYQVFNSNQYI
ncbi:She10p ASCRUDRAFT_71483 [Ascoidea rubescens DSM 1968]|uniref:Uncharacterized protein n=1 Tax=Ascoidea rubescens DSM 1968 TaxID=1344418 RepID=A0A1D2VDH9_9ASCO|nr:hypothetical protein ASCRUDRAFT_71483 [Ascoidea rubescens DSM 1968]ODV59517.1 hypothetical protein ASCRUDRAFT_71483 [Ascoidea rubescens DSM 1968]